MVKRIEYAVRSHADVDLCWKVFTDCEHWNSFVPGTYGKIEWVGEPWAVESRVRMELFLPVPLKTDCVIIGSSPPNKVGWINHELENAVEQWVFFQPLDEGGTVISLWLEIRGNTQMLQGRDIGIVMREYKENWYNRLAQKCDELAVRGRISVTEQGQGSGKSAQVPKRPQVRSSSVSKQKNREL
jgi:hypothetical protein